MGTWDSNLALSLQNKSPSPLCYCLSHMPTYSCLIRSLIRSRRARYLCSAALQKGQKAWRPLAPGHFFLRHFRCLPQLVYYASWLISTFLIVKSPSYDKIICLGDVKASQPGSHSASLSCLCVCPYTDHWPEPKAHFPDSPFWAKLYCTPHVLTKYPA